MLVVLNHMQGELQAMLEMPNRKQEFAKANIKNNIFTTLSLTVLIEYQLEKYTNSI